MLILNLRGREVNWRWLILKTFNRRTCFFKSSKPKYGVPTTSRLPHEFYTKICGGTGTGDGYTGIYKSTEEMVSLYKCQR